MNTVKRPHLGCLCKSWSKWPQKKCQSFALHIFIKMLTCGLFVWQRWMMVSLVLSKCMADIWRQRSWTTPQLLLVLWAAKASNGCSETWLGVTQGALMARAFTWVHSLFSRSPQDCCCNCCDCRVCDCDIQCLYIRVLGVMCHYPGVIALTNNGSNPTRQTDVCRNARLSSSAFAVDCDVCAAVQLPFSHPYKKNLKHIDLFLGLTLPEGKDRKYW